MRKIFLSMAAALALVFTACDPVEDFTENTATIITNPEDVDVTWTQDGNKVSVTVHSGTTAQISNGKQTIKSNSADIIMREEGANTLYITLFNADGSTTVKEIPVQVPDLKYEVPILETIIWQGEQSCVDWDGASCRFSDSEGKLPSLSDEIYDQMVGKKMCVDISAVAGDGTTIRLTTGWWSINGDGSADVAIEAGSRFQFEVTPDLADLFKQQDLLFVSNKGFTITKLYYEL